nr:hypothetical protein [Tanacetum cinerariifolium]
MVNTCQSTPEFFGPAFDEVVQRAVNALLPGLTAQITNELHQNGVGSNVDVENWNAHIKKLFKVLGCANEFKARLASYKFEGDALNWWKAFKQAKGSVAYMATLSWKDFCWQVSLERKWVLQKSRINILTNAGRNIELLREQGGVNNKRNRDGDRIQSANKKNNQRGYGQKGNDDRNYDRQGGYMAKDCPKNNRGNGNDKQPDVKGKVYSLTRDQAAKSSSTVTGTLFINGRAVFVLFDTGATHSVISVLISKYINVPPILLNYTLSISTPMRSLVVIDREYQNCPLQFDDKIRSANLFSLDMYDFDIIMGMDWLINHRATIVCHTKSVIFGNLDKPEFVYQDSQLGLLASLIDTSSDGPSLETHPIVWDFSDVFPEEIPGIPPEREVEFGIKLIPSTQPISKASYRQVAFLGQIVSADGITMDPAKVEAITKWPRPKTVTAVRSFLGPEGYYSRFMEGFSRLALPLTKLMRKGEKFVWNEEREKRFEEKKKNTLTTLLLLHVIHVGNLTQARNGKVYSLTRDQAAKSSSTVTGTLFMNGRAVFVLFATHFVISVLLSKYINVPPILLNYTLSISTPMRSLVVIDSEYQNCLLQFDDKIRSANLFSLDMYDFDIILGMDWLINHRATIVCHTKSVIFGDLDKPEF